MIKLTKQQAQAIDTIVVEIDKKGYPVLVITPKQIGDDEFIIDEDHEEEILKKIKKADLVKQVYTKEEIDLKVDAFVKNK